MAEGLYTDEEEEAEPSPSASHPSTAHSHDSQAGAHPERPSTQPQQVPQTLDRPAPKQDDAASRDVEREIAQALAADAAFLEDPSLSLREGALQPLMAGQDEGFELPALTAGGTISKVSAVAGSVTIIASFSQATQGLAKTACDYDMCTAGCARSGAWAGQGQLHLPSD